MSNSGIQVESSNIQNILIALVVICAVIYAFIEFRKINTKIQQLEIDFSKLKNNFVSLLNNDIPNNILHKPVDSKKETVKEKNNIVENTITENTITENTDAENNDIVTNNIVENKYTTENEIIMDTIINQVEGELNKPPIMSGLFMSIEKPIHTDNRIEELDEESKIEESKIEESNIEESNIEESKIEESTIEYNNSEYIYEEYTIRELKEKLTELNLSTSGNKNKLIERIISHENKM